jgi:hypothetical protein
MISTLLGCALVSAPVLGGTIQIEVTGANLNYSDPDGGGAGTGTLEDAGTPADPLTAILFSDDAVPAGILTSPPDSLTLDLLVGSIPNIAIPAPNSSNSVTAPAGGSLTLAVSAGTILDLDLDAVEVVYSRINFSVFDIRVMFTGSVGTIASQNLPFGLNVADPVTVTFTLQGSSSESGGFLTSFIGSGTGVLTAPVPEPSSLLLAMATIAFVGSYSRRHR